MTVVAAGAIASLVVVVGVLLARRPRHPVTIVLLVMTLSTVLMVGGSAPAWLNDALWVLSVLPLSCLLIAFPDGPRGRGWSLVFGLTAALIGVTCLLTFADGATGTLAEVLRVMGVVAAMSVIPVAAAAVVSLVRLWRRSTGDRRFRVGLALGAGAVLVVPYLTMAPVAGVSYLLTGGVPTWVKAYEAVVDATFIFTLVPLAVGVSMLLEPVGRRLPWLERLWPWALSLSTALIVGGAVAGVAAAVEGPAGGPAAVAAGCLAAGAVVAGLSALLRRRALAPYEVLARFSEVMGETRPNDVVLDELARVVGEGTGAREAAVWLRLERSLHLAAAWPASPVESPPVAVLVGRDLPALPAEVTVPVRHDQELLGALTLSMPTSEAAGPGIRRLIADLAGQAGLVLRNVQLIEELRASRRRLVTAADQERRRLERNLHDGAQQQLIALKLRLRLAEEVIGEDPALLRPTLAELADAAQSALDDLRDLARGIYPPLLADQGLGAAIETQAKRSPVEVRVDADPIPRYPAEIEAAAYFCCLEALQNVAKYAKASSATVRLRTEDGALVFAVSDDGEGFDTAQIGYGTGLQGMADRLAALGGSLAVRSEPGTGTTVTGRLPVGGVTDVVGEAPGSFVKSHPGSTGTRGIDAPVQATAYRRPGVQRGAVDPAPRPPVDQDPQQRTAR
jgi:signal transduction histidine kinase